MVKLFKLMSSSFITLHVWFFFLIAASLAGTNNPSQMREKLYLLAVGYYRNGDYSRSRKLVDRCLEVRIWLISHETSINRLNFILIYIYIYISCMISISRLHPTGGRHWLWRNQLKIILEKVIHNPISARVGLFLFHICLSDGSFSSSISCLHFDLNFI